VGTTAGTLLALAPGSELAAGVLALGAPLESAGSEGRWLTR
jgi:hypothetical protein